MTDPVEGPAAGSAADDPGEAGQASRVPLLEARGITRSYGSVEALSGVDLQLMPGEVVGLVGDNGAGHRDRLALAAG